MWVGSGPHARQLSRVEVRQTADGRLLAAEAHTGEVDRDDLQRSARATLQRLRRTFTGAQDVRLVEARIGVRPMPVAGRLVAAEVVDGLDGGGS